MFQFFRSVVVALVVLLFSTSAFSQDNRSGSELIDNRYLIAMSMENEDGRIPHYNNGSLKIPVVNTDAQPGLFQDGEFVFDTAINAWRLTTFRATPVIEGLIDEVELIKKNTKPVQVFLKISGPNTSCYTPGKIGLRKSGNRFDVSAGFTPPQTEACTTAMVSFEATVSLPVFNLPAGTYEYNVNGKFSGSFELTEDNTL